MELEPLFIATRWEILKLLAEKRHSPLELSMRLKTTIANVSQQLRLLQMAGLVKTERLQQRDKGKPRMLYSIASDFGYLVMLASPMANKKLLSLSRNQSVIMRIWFLDDARLHDVIESFFWKIEPFFDKVKAFFIDLHSSELYIITDYKELKTRYDKSALNANVKVKVLPQDELKKLPGYLYFFYQEEKFGEVK